MDLFTTYHTPTGHLVLPSARGQSCASVDTFARAPWLSQWVLRLATASPYYSPVGESETEAPVGHPGSSRLPLGIVRSVL